MTNEEMLIEIRKDRPAQVIHEVNSFELNAYGFYDVKVDMEVPGGDNGIFVMPTVKHVKMKLPYPYKEFRKLTDHQQAEWRWK